MDKSDSTTVIAILIIVIIGLLAWGYGSHEAAVNLTARKHDQELAQKQISDFNTTITSMQKSAREEEERLTNQLTQMKASLENVQQLSQTEIQSYTQQIGCLHKELAHVRDCLALYKSQCAAATRQLQTITPTQEPVRVCARGVSQGMRVEVPSLRESGAPCHTGTVLYTTDSSAMVDMGGGFVLTVDKSALIPAGVSQICDPESSLPAPPERPY